MAVSPIRLTDEEYLKLKEDMFWAGMNATTNMARTMGRIKSKDFDYEYFGEKVFELYIDYMRFLRYQRKK